MYLVLFSFLCRHNKAIVSSLRVFDRHWPFEYRHWWCLWVNQLLLQTTHGYPWWEFRVAALEPAPYFDTFEKKLRSQQHVTCVLWLSFHKNIINISYQWSEGRFQVHSKNEISICSKERRKWDEGVPPAVSILVRSADLMLNGTHIVSCVPAEIYKFLSPHMILITEFFSCVCVSISDADMCKSRVIFSAWKLLAMRIQNLK